MPIDYTQFAGETPSSLYAKNPNGLPPGFSWADFDKANGTNFSSPASLPGYQRDFTFGGGGTGQVTFNGTPVTQPDVPKSATTSTTPALTTPASAPAANPLGRPGGTPQSNPLGRPDGAPLFPTGSIPGGSTSASTLPYGGAAPGAPPDLNALINSFFGGDASSGESRAVSRTGLDPRLDSLYQFALGQALSRYGDPAGQTFYPGQTVASLTPDELKAQDMLRGLSSTMGATAGQPLDYISSLMTNAANPGEDPTLNAAIAATKAGIVQDATDPGGVFSKLRDQSIGNGAVGGTRQAVMEAVAKSRLGAQLANTDASMRLAGREQDLQAAQQGINSLPTAINAATTPASLLSSVGTQNRDQSQLQLNDALQRWAYNTYEPDRRLQNLFQLLGAAPLGQYNAASSTMSPAGLAALQSAATSGPSDLQNILGILAAGGSAASLLHNAGFF